MSDIVNVMEVEQEDGSLVREPMTWTASKAIAVVVREDGRRELALSCSHAIDPLARMPMGPEETELEALRRFVAFHLCDPERAVCPPEPITNVYVLRKDAGDTAACPTCGGHHVFVSMDCLPVAANIPDPFWTVVGGTPEVAAPGTKVWYWHHSLDRAFRPLVCP